MEESGCAQFCWAFASITGNTERDNENVNQFRPFLDQYQNLGILILRN
jgi:hypothetical protein